MWAGPPTRKKFRGGGGGGETADDVIRRKMLCYSVWPRYANDFQPPSLFFLDSGAPMGPAHKNSKFRVRF